MHFFPLSTVISRQSAPSNYAYRVEMQCEHLQKPFVRISNSREHAEGVASTVAALLDHISRPNGIAVYPEICHDTPARITLATDYISYAEFAAATLATPSEISDNAGYIESTYYGNELPLKTVSGVLFALKRFYVAFRNYRGSLSDADECTAYIFLPARVMRITCNVVLAEGH